jgi:hypothetical protein
MGKGQKKWNEDQKRVTWHSGSALPDIPSFHSSIFPVF